MEDQTERRCRLCKRWSPVLNGRFGHCHPKDQAAPVYWRALTRHTSVLTHYDKGSDCEAFLGLTGPR